MKRRTAIALTLDARAASAGFDFSEFRDLDDDLHFDLVDEIHQVKAVLKGAPKEFPIYLLDCPARKVKVAVEANGPDVIAAGDFVLLPEELGEQRDEWFILRLLMPVEDRNKNITAIAASLKPHLLPLAQFLTSAGFSDVTSGIEVEVEPERSEVAAVASTLLADGTLLRLTFEVSFSNLAVSVSDPFCDGTLFAYRTRFDSGVHLSSEERLAFIEAVPACSRKPVEVHSYHTLFQSDPLNDDTPWVMAVDAPLAIAAVDVRRELLSLDMSALRLSELFD